MDSSQFVPVVVAYWRNSSPAVINYLLMAIDRVGMTRPFRVGPEYKAASVYKGYAGQITIIPNNQSSALVKQLGIHHSYTDFIPFLRCPT